MAAVIKLKTMSAMSDINADTGSNTSMISEPNGGNIFLLPFCFALLLKLTFLSSYVVALKMDHIHPYFPYSSDIGTLPPESCLFGQLMNFVAFLFMLNVYFRYHHVHEVFKIKETSRFVLSNKIGFWFGILVSLGFTLRGNFQEMSVVLFHNLGMFLCYAIGTLYMCIHTAISYRLMYIMNPRWMFYFRFFLCFYMFFFTLIAIGCGIQARLDAEIDFEDTLLWAPQYGGYLPHVLSTGSEWLLSFGLILFTLSFSYDFKDLRYHGPFFIAINLLTEQPEESESHSQRTVTG